MTEPSIENLRKASSAVYLACEEAVAADISNLLRWAANELQREHRENEHLKSLVEGYKNLAR